MNNQILKGLAFGAAAFLLATGAQAMDGDGDKASVKVDYSDLDLTSADGVAELDKRIARAAIQACNLVTRNENHSQYERKSCRKAATASISPRRQSLIAAARAGGAIPKLDMSVRLAARAD